MANFKISIDLLVMLVGTLVVTITGVVTGATFFTILGGSCLALIVIELVATRGHVTE